MDLFSEAHRRTPPELDVHSSRFVTVTVTRVCAGAWANVHHTLVSVWRDGDGFESSPRMS